jgi:hypothetical protein
MKDVLKQVKDCNYGIFFETTAITEIKHPYSWENFPNLPVDDTSTYHACHL